MATFVVGPVEEAGVDAVGVPAVDPDQPDGGVLLVDGVQHQRHAQPETSTYRIVSMISRWPYVNGRPPLAGSRTGR
jgi:hypothetical protein